MSYSVYDRMMYHAYTLTEMVHGEYKEGKKIAYFPLLVGIGNLKVENAGAGHNYSIVVDAIHKYYLQSKDDTVKKGFEEGISTMFRMTKNITTLQVAFDVFFYQLKLEKKGTATFNVDRDWLTNELNETIRENYNAMKSENSRFEDWLQKNKEYAVENYGIKLTF